VPRDLARKDRQHGDAHGAPKTCLPHAAVTDTVVRGWAPPVVDTLLAATAIEDDL